MSNENITLPIQELERRFRSVIVRLPVLAGNEVVNFALDNFKRQGFWGDTLQPWRPRKNPNKWGQAPKRNSRSILVDTGRLKRSIRMVSHNLEEVVIGSDVPYAKAHNDGLRQVETQNVKEHTRKITKVGIVKTVSRKKKTNIEFGRKQTGSTTVAAHTRKINQNIPARKFLGQSQYLNNQLSRVVEAEILKALK